MSELQPSLSSASVTPSHYQGMKTNRAPLRKIVSRRWYLNDPATDLLLEWLECGHEQSARHDHRGRTNASRRRCFACGKEGRTDASSPDLRVVKP